MTAERELAHRIVVAGLLGLAGIVVAGLLGLAGIVVAGLLGLARIVVAGLLGLVVALMALPVPLDEAWPAPARLRWNPQMPTSTAFAWRPVGAPYGPERGSKPPPRQLRNEDGP